MALDGEVEALDGEVEKSRGHTHRHLQPPPHQLPCYRKNKKSE